MEFSMSAMVRFNRAVNLDTDWISPGGYEIVSGGKSYRFDFECSELDVDNRDLSVCYIDVHSVDFDAYEETKLITPEVLAAITSIPEFFIDTEYSNNLHPIALLKCTFCVNDTEYIDVPASVLKKAVVTNGEPPTVLFK